MRPGAETVHAVPGVGDRQQNEAGVDQVLAGFAPAFGDPYQPINQTAERVESENHQAGPAQRDPPDQLWGPSPGFRQPFTHQHLVHRPEDVRMAVHDQRAAHDQQGGERSHVDGQLERTSPAPELLQ